MNDNDNKKEQLETSAAPSLAASGADIEAES